MDIKSFFFVVPYMLFLSNTWILADVTVRLFVTGLDKYISKTCHLHHFYTSIRTMPQISDKNPPESDHDADARGAEKRFPRVLQPDASPQATSASSNLEQYRSMLFAKP